MTVTNTKGVFYLNKYLETLCKMMNKQYTLQSDFAREHAFIIAEAASRGHISSVLSGTATNAWYVTAKGFKLLKKEGYV
nr:MAG TPA: Fusion protein 5.5/5.7 effector, anti-sigma effector, transcription [Caudoviricetes sp.]